MKAYAIGQQDERPWGHYKVNNIGFLPDGREFCEKLITVSRGCILSLQSHNYRAESWYVVSGALTGILAHERIFVETGGRINVPLGTVHTMANLDNEPLIIHEIQTGKCFETDIVRYCDAYGRSHVKTGPPSLYFSMSLYKNILEEIRHLSR